MTTSPTSVFTRLQKSGRRGLQVAAKSSGTLTEAGVGALMPWNDRLYYNVYNAESGQSSGLGLFSMGLDDGRAVLEVEQNVCDAARILHVESKQVFIGRNVISASGVITQVTGFNAYDRVAGYCRDPLSTTGLYALTMATASQSLPPFLYRVDTTTKVATLVKDLSTFGTNFSPSSHLKAIWSAGTGSGARLYLADNNYGEASPLTVYNPNTNGIGTINNYPASWIEIASSLGNANNSNTVFMFGADNSSALLWCVDPNVDPTVSSNVLKLRLPLASWSMWNYTQQEWMRARQVATERFLVDLHGTWYDLAAMLGGAATIATGGMPRMRALSRHYGTYPDFCFFDGQLVLGVNASSPQGVSWPISGQPQGGLVFTDIESVATGPKPDGGAYWTRSAAVTSGTELWPVLCLGMAPNRTIGVQNDSATTCAMTVSGYFGNKKITLGTIAGTTGFTSFTLPSGLTPDWVSLTPTASTTGITAFITFS